MLRVDDGSVVTLGAVLARAGEGTIYEIADRPDRVAKIFHPGLKDLDAKRAKVAAMVASPPDNAMQSDGFVVLTWPLHVVDGDGSSGYMMSRVDTSNAVEIHAVSNPSGRMNPLPSAPQWTPHITWFHLVSVAANLCLAVETVHKVDAVIGDFQERNILVNDTTRVTLVDCDSMQFTDDSGNQFLCGVGRPEFTAPELAGQNLATTARRKPSDLFALAVHIHQLLMGGNHPFQRGTWMGGGEQPDALTLAKTGQWAGGPGSALHSHPLAPPVDFLPGQLQALFIRAFTDGAGNPDARPTAAEWRQALLAVRVTNCPRGHQVPIETSRCPWCIIDDERTVRRNQWAGNRASQTAYQVGSATPATDRAGYRSGTTTYATTPPPSVTGRRNRRAPLLAAAGVGATALAVGLVAIVTNSTGDTTATPTTTRTAWSSTTADSPRASGRMTTTTSRTAVPRPDASRVALNVNTPISQPNCDGMGIVVLSNAVTPGRYDAEIQSALNRFPGASYLRTDHSCPSLRQMSDNGTPIYAVYRPAGRTQADVCAAVRRAGGGAYGKWLDTTTDPKYIIPC
ncbi:protein kinase [Mycobacterium sp. 852014-52144_SCH5372336]|uniref:protein kinase n=1 Tax=Mycobacterium sp. 852014-52144_SCH5372336 TaxID=1834115 RepID=UPI0007FEA1F1|nr:protein kinase [Mycobacterium sp. 852014-52144_SCH5372336]OBB77409.1 hypothetical protein A5759_04000 [Mycobacterium sp. 852014-52144_SCH5372336]